MGNKLHFENLKDIVDKVYVKNPEATIWDILVELFSDGENKGKYKIQILSELPVVEAVARGYNSRWIQDAYDMGYVTVRRIYNHWGLKPLKEISDFDPLKIYTDGMTAEQLKIALVPIIQVLPSKNDLKTCINNIKIYKDIVEYLNDLEEEESGI